LILIESENRIKSKKKTVAEAEFPREFEKPCE